MSTPLTPRVRIVHRTLWVLQWLLGASLVGAGVLKLSLPFDQAVAMFPWAADVPALYTVTSVLDVLGGLGVVVPSLTRILPRTTVLAALGVLLLMLSAVGFYLIRGEVSEIIANLVLAGVAAVIAWGRWRVAPITAQLPEPSPFMGELPLAAPPAAMQVFQLPTGSYLTRAAFAVVGGDFADAQDYTDNVAWTRDGRSWTVGAGLRHIGEDVTYLRGWRYAVATGDYDGSAGTSITTDGGATWQRVSKLGYHVIDCAGKVCWAAGSKGRVGHN